MKKYLKCIFMVFCMLLAALAAGCGKEKKTAGTGRMTGEELTSEKGCIRDEDCAIGGCSGTVCQSRYAEPVRTMCIFLPEHECYKEISCGCLERGCQWEKTDEFENCVREARGN
ncbi:hypothetical protein KY358_01130 [Candidatus Woesearchaeota archaeon]|nr:hypothetical protein [Candidatus Woesearchaeota archaeon]